MSHSNRSFYPPHGKVKDERCHTRSVMSTGLCYNVTFSVTTSPSGCCKNAISHSLCHLALFCLALVFCVTVAQSPRYWSSLPGEQGTMHLLPVPSWDSKHRCPLHLGTRDSKRIHHSRAVDGIMPHLHKIKTGQAQPPKLALVPHSQWDFPGSHCREICACAPVSCHRERNPVPLPPTESRYSSGSARCHMMHTP